MIDRTQKYDRQLRLWHAHGQQALENAKLCLINASALGTELLKNLVLPGIGSCTIVDGKIVEGRDLGQNFFLEASSLGSSRAKCTAEFLSELNDDVIVDHMDKDFAALLESDPDYFKRFTIVVATQVPREPLLKLADLCWNADIPLVVVKAQGFIGCIRIVMPELTVVETHPDQIVDLRLDCPFPELERYVNSFDLDKLDSMAHSHVPFIVILIQCLNEWKAKNGGQLPKTYPEKNAFKELIRSKQRSDAPDGENFGEALTSYYRACTETKLSDNIKRVFADPKVENITKTTSNFWIIARAVRDFTQNEGGGRLPLAGVVPDMKADTESFVSMQTIYRKKAKEDIQKVTERVHALLSSVDKSADSVPLEEIERFCKHGDLVRVIRYRSLAEELAPTNHKNEEIGRLMEDIDSNIVYYILFRALDVFYETHKRSPGVFSEDVEADIGLFRKSVNIVLSTLQLSPSSVSDEYIQQIVRSGDAEPHVIASFLGGVASQEIIKIITHQYVPINNTFIYNDLLLTMNSIGILRRLGQRSFYTWHLPKDSKRCKLDDGSLFIHRKLPNSTDQVSTESSLPPRLRSYPQRSKLTESQIQEARMLRQQDPDTWTVSELAKKYNTFPGFIMSIAPCPKGRKAYIEQQKREQFESLPLSKKVTMIDRARRKALW
ncbi:NEDD8-activating enzyme E1 regulatory subunit [Chytridiales sp. JEL 0842]|nr:NEDD8-activating enzyme E1 regulatory subunit [Chytridiales sp. JEL 0842]